MRVASCLASVALVVTLVSACGSDDIRVDSPNGMYSVEAQLIMEAIDPTWDLSANDKEFLGERRLFGCINGDDSGNELYADSLHWIDDETLEITTERGVATIDMQSEPVVTDPRNLIGVRIDRTCRGEPERSDCSLTRVQVGPSVVVARSTLVPSAALRRAASRTVAVATASQRSTGTGALPRTAAANCA